MELTCPVCKTKFEGTVTSPGFPFCSTRCKLIDLGRWMDGTNNLPTTEPDDDELGSEDEG